MPKQISKETTPDEIVEIAREYQTLLKQSNVDMKLEQATADMERRAADLNNETVDQWKARHATMANAAVITEPVAPKKKAEKKERGTVTGIDHSYFYMDPKNDAKATTWMELRHKMGIVMNMLVLGPSGFGKTETFTKYLKARFGVPVYKVDCPTITAPDKWVGHKELVATEHGQETQYVLSQHLQWLGALNGFEPGILLYDEVNRLNPMNLNMLNSILDGSQRIWVPDLGTYAEVHPQTMFAATMNQGVGYSGTHAMDISFMDRFGAVMEVGPPPKPEEIKILMRRTGLDEARAQILVNTASQCRVLADDGKLSKYVSTRALLDWSFWVMAGQSIEEAAQSTFVLKYSAEGKGDSERALVTVTVKGFAGGK